MCVYFVRFSFQLFFLGGGGGAFAKQERKKKTPRLDGGNGARRCKRILQIKLDLEILIIFVHHKFGNPHPVCSSLP